MILGIDVAGSYQGLVPSSTWPAIRFLVAKMSQGAGWVDPHGRANLVDAAANGVVPFGYHFADTTGPGAAQCDHFLAQFATLDRIGFALDVEHGGLGQIIPEFLDRFAQRLPGRALLVYSNRGLWASSGGGAIYPHYPFVVEWHAGASNGVYTPVHGSLAAEAAAASINPTSFGGMSIQPCMVQFSDHSQVPGLGAGVDGDLWTGTFDQLRALAGIAPAPADPQEDDVFIRATTNSADGTVKAGDVVQETGGGHTHVPNPTILNEIDPSHQLVSMTGDELALLLAQEGKA